MSSRYGRPATDWKVITIPKALSPPKVFAQIRKKGADHHYNVVLIEDTNAAALDLSVSFLPLSSMADMGGGLNKARMLPELSSADRGKHSVKQRALRARHQQVYTQVIGMDWSISKTIHPGDVLFYGEKVCGCPPWSSPRTIEWS